MWTGSVQIYGFSSIYPPSDRSRVLEANGPTELSMQSTEKSDTPLVNSVLFDFSPVDPLGEHICRDVKHTLTFITMLSVPKDCPTNFETVFPVVKSVLWRDFSPVSGQETKMYIVCMSYHRCGKGITTDCR